MEKTYDFVEADYTELKISHIILYKNMFASRIVLVETDDQGVHCAVKGDVNLAPNVKMYRFYDMAGRWKK